MVKSCVVITDQMIQNCHGLSRNACSSPNNYNPSFDTKTRLSCNLMGSYVYVQWIIFHCCIVEGCTNGIEYQFFNKKKHLIMHLLSIP